MGKSIRSKIKKYWRNELRQTIGKDDLVKREAHIQQELKKALASQGKTGFSPFWIVLISNLDGSSIMSLKDKLGSGKIPVSISENQAMDTDVVSTVAVQEVKPYWKKKKSTVKKKTKKLVHFHKLRKKGT